jgi:uncharacterized protein (TIGR02217 family)
MTLATFPVLPGIAWNIGKTPVMSTRVMTAASGKEYRAQNWSYPRWKFKLPIEFLRQYGSRTEWSTIVGFILSQAGQFGNFLYNDPFDNLANNQAIGAGTGNQTAFPLVRTIGGFTEPILAVNTISSVKVAGTPTSAYTLSSTYGYTNDTINFNTAPLLNQSITASFTFFFVCHFLTDDPEFTNFMGGQSGGTRWSCKELPFESVK